MVLDEVFGGALDFAGVLDDDKPVQWGRASTISLMMALTSVVLPEPVPPITRMLRCAATASCDGLRLCCGHDSGFDVLLKREDGDGLLADGKDWRRHDRGELAREARTVKRQFAFE